MTILQEAIFFTAMFGAAMVLLTYIYERNANKKR